MVIGLSSYENAFMAICQKCDKTFDIKFTVINSINVDFKGTQRQKLLNNNINRITCPHCGCDFTYERPFVAYSFENEFAILTDFKFHGGKLYFGRKNLFDLFKYCNMKFRVVNYMCEVSEKYRIFNIGLDDYKIEYLKFKLFDAEYFNDKPNEILLFDKFTDDNITFNLYSDTDEILQTFNVPFEEYNKINIKFNPQYYLNDQCIWHKIDTNYIKEHINE